MGQYEFNPMERNISPMSGEDAGEVKKGRENLKKHEARKKLEESEVMIKEAAKFIKEHQNLSEEEVETMIRDLINDVEDASSEKFGNA